MLDFASFAVRVERKDLPRLPQILRAIPPHKIVSMQRAIARVWERYSYSSIGVAEARRRCPQRTDDAGVGSAGREDDDECESLPRHLRPPWARVRRRRRAAGRPSLTGRDAIDTLMHVLQARLLERQKGGWGQATGQTTGQATGQTSGWGERQKSGAYWG